MKTELILAAYIMVGTGAAINLDSWKDSLNLRAMIHVVRPFAPLPRNTWYMWAMDVILWPFTSAILCVRYGLLSAQLKDAININSELDDANEIVVWGRNRRYYISAKNAKPLVYKNYLDLFQWFLARGYEIIAHSSRSATKADLNYQLWVKRKDNPYAVYNSESEHQNSETVSEVTDTPRGDDPERGDIGEVREDVLQVGEENHREVKEGVLPEDPEERS